MFALSVYCTSLALSAPTRALSNAAEVRWITVNQIIFIWLNETVIIGIFGPLNVAAVKSQKVESYYYYYQQQLETYIK